jgi:hypothetical protein
MTHLANLTDKPPDIGLLILGVFNLMAALLIQLAHSANKVLDAISNVVKRFYRLKDELRHPGIRADKPRQRRARRRQRGLRGKPRRTRTNRNERTRRR